MESDCRGCLLEASVEWTGSVNCLEWAGHDGRVVCVREKEESKGNKEDGAPCFDAFAIRVVGSKGGRRGPK